MTKTLITRRITVSLITFAVLVFAVIAFAANTIAAEDADIKIRYISERCNVYIGADEKRSTAVLEVNTPVTCMETEIGYTKIIGIFGTGYVCNENLSDERTWVKEYGVVYAKDDDTLLMSKADDESEIICIADTNAPLSMSATNGAWMRVTYKCKTAYVRVSEVSHKPVIADGFYADESMNGEEIKAANEYLEKYFSLLPEIWSQFNEDGWTYCVTDKKIADFLEDENIDDEVNVEGKIIGLTVFSQKTVITTLDYIDEAAIHELGHYIYKEYLSNAQKNEFKKIYSRLMDEDLGIYAYSEHHKMNCSEFFCESLQFYLVGLEACGNAEKVDTLPEAVREFMEEYICK